MPPDPFRGFFQLSSTPFRPSTSTPRLFIRQMPTPASILSLPKRTPELRDLLIKWCNQNSGTANLPGVAAMLRLLQTEFDRLGRTEAVSLPGTTAQALRLRVRPEAPVQLFLSGHYDTVYDATHPFQQCTLLSPETLRGPGTADMKGGLVVMLAALQAFEKTPHASRIGYEILIGPDE